MYSRDVNFFQSFLTANTGIAKELSVFGAMQTAQCKSWRKANGATQMAG